MSKKKFSGTTEEERLSVDRSWRENKEPTCGKFKQTVMKKQQERDIF